MKSGPRYFVISSVFTLTPTFCLGHAGQRGFVMLLPTDLFILGGGIVVALTFLFVVLMAKSPAKLNAHVAIQTSSSSANQLTIWSRLTLILWIFWQPGPSRKSFAIDTLDGMVGRLDFCHSTFGRFLEFDPSLACT